jgi:hypothetical protein
MSAPTWEQIETLALNGDYCMGGCGMPEGQTHTTCAFTALARIAMGVQATLRMEWWSNHGCDSMARYGDDGEMQCAQCKTDFKREPFDGLKEKVEQSRLRRLHEEIKNIELNPLVPRFIEAMADIGNYGFEKYGEKTFQHRRLRGDLTRGDLARTTKESLAAHTRDHLDAYLRGEKHDHFGTLRHQLAAAAFNTMMECFFAGLENERSKK